MKQLFTKETDALLLAHKENEIYSYYDFESRKRIFLDRNGDVIENYTLPLTPYDTQENHITDLEFVKTIGEGFYVYTTHEIMHDPDGEFGSFGIKYISGEKLTEEIYFQVGDFCNGLCSVSEKWGKWGCINTDGDLVIPYKFAEELRFNKYGVAVGNLSLIDRNGDEISDTDLDYEEDCSEDNRYFVFSVFTQEQESCFRDGREIEDLKVNIYDTKTRQYVAKGIPEMTLDVYCFDGEPDVVLAAVDLLRDFEWVCVQKSGTIIGKKGKKKTVFSFYEK